MPSFTYVTIVNFAKRKIICKTFTKMCEAIDFMKTYTRGKDCFMYAERNGEILAVKNDLLPMKVYDRSSDYDVSFEFEYVDNHKVFFDFVVSPTISRFGFHPPARDLF